MAKQGARRSSHAQLAAPLELSDKRRIERKAAAEAAHADVSGWEGAVQKQAAAESLSFPPERQHVHGATLGSLTAGASKNDLERGVDELLEAQVSDPAHFRDTSRSGSRR